MSNPIIEEMLRWKSPKRVDEMFNLICVHNYFAGQFSQPIPTDVSRKVFEHIKKLLSQVEPQS